MEDMSSDPDFYGSDNDMDVSSGAASRASTPSNGLKRKASDEAAPEAPSKKVNLGKYWQTAALAHSYRESALRAAWFNIFLYLPPTSLLTLVKLPTFRPLLTSVAPTPSGNKKSKSNKVEHMGSDDVWAHSRKVFCPNMPRPFQTMSERQQFQLLDSKECSRCHKTGTPSTTSLDVFHAGPGPTGIRVVWPFKAALCGGCLLAGTISQASALQAYPRFAKALPGAYVSRSGPHYVMSIDMDLMIKTKSVPRNVSIQVYHSLKDLGEFQRQEQEIRERLGDAAHDAWLNGQDERKEAAKKDYERWEKWERDHVGLGGDLFLKLLDYDGNPPAKSASTAQSKFAAHSSPSTPGKHLETSIPSTSSSQHPAAFLFTRRAPNPSPGHFPALPQPLPPRPVQPSSGYRYQFSLPVKDASAEQPHGAANAKSEKTIEAVREERKSDIERRCRDLQPPITPVELLRMKSYDTTMKIVRPMDDAQWDVLLPRLLQERRLLALATTHGPGHGPRYPRTAEQLRKEALEAHRTSIRQRLEGFAREVIQSDWNGGRINRADVPKFAVAVLLHVAKSLEEDAQEPDFLPGLFSAPMEGSPTWLTLADMKWVYDLTVYPLICHHNFDPFLCSRMTGSTKNETVVEEDSCLYVALDNESCDPKWYPFDSLMQHWTSKHIDGDRSGTDWTMPWTDELPFVTDPAVWAAHMPGPAPSHRREPNNSHHERPLNGGGRHGATERQVGNGPDPPEEAAEKAAKEATAVAAIRRRKEIILRLGARLSTIWDIFAGIEGIPDSVRLQIAIHHMCKEERSTPDLDDLTLTLMELNPPSGGYHSVKDAKGLHCKLCMVQNPERAKEYNISSLTAHFKLLHPEDAYAQTTYGQETAPSWPAKMIDLPSDKDIRRYANGVPDEALDFYVQTFSEAMAQADSEEETVHKVDDLASKLFNKATKKKNKSSKKRKRASEQTHMPQPDEYDPTNPMLPDPAEEDEARFDTLVRDQARRAQTAVQDDAASVGTPSVGRRSESPSHRNSMSALPQQEPDIQAMLAQLQRGGLIPAPSAYGSQTAPSAAHQSHGPDRNPSERYHSSYSEAHNYPPGSGQMRRETAVPNLQDMFGSGTPNPAAQQPVADRGYAYPQPPPHQPQYQFYQSEPVQVIVPQPAQHYTHTQGAYTPARTHATPMQQQYVPAPRYVIDQYGREVPIFPVHEWQNNGAGQPQNTAQQSPPQPDPRYGEAVQTYRYM